MVGDLDLSAARWIWVGGKGGVGKTTVGAALALELADRGEPTLVLSVDPAHSLGDALGSALGREPRQIATVPGLWALELDAEYERARFLEQQGEELRTLFERGTYLAREDIDELLSLAVPGLDEAAAVLRLLALRHSREFSRLVIDTAPTGHTLRLLDFPRLLADWLDALDALEERQRRVAEALSPVRAAEPATHFLASLRADVADLARQFTDERRTRFVLVTTPEPVVIAETRRFRDALSRAGVALAGVVVNRVRGHGAGVSPTELTGNGERLAITTDLPLLAEEPLGIDGLRRLLYQTRVVVTGATGERAAGVVRASGHWVVPGDRRLYLVGGKGGVGKSTIASALALSLADTGRRVLLLSTDPAGSLGEIWGAPVRHRPIAAPGVAGLWLRQLEAATAWNAFRSAHQAEADQFFAGVLGQGGSAADRRALQRLLELAPPGIDELMALLQVVDLLDRAAYNAVVLDTAPTGHLLRLLELPGVALDWAHAIMRLLLRYREVMGLGAVAERVLEFARSVRRLRDALQDSSQTLIAAVALPEGLSVPETERLVGRLNELGLRADVLLVNRLLDPDAAIPPECAGFAQPMLTLQEDAEAVGAPSLRTGPRGAAQLRDFAAAWRRLEAA